MTQSLQLQASEKSLKKDQQLGFNLSDMELDQAIQIHKGGSLFTRQPFKSFNYKKYKKML